MGVIVIMLLVIFLFVGWLAGIIPDSVDWAFPTVVGLTAMTIAGICMIMERLEEIRMIVGNLENSLYKNEKSEEDKEKEKEGEKEDKS